MLEANIMMLKGPIIITVIYFMMWYYLLFFLQRKTKYRLQEKYKREGKEFDRYFGQDDEMLSADRAVINTQEQMVPFIMALWLCSIFVSPVLATWCGGLYIILRLFYPLLLGRRVSKIQSKRVYFVTFTSYLIIFFMFGSIIWTVLK